jgi:hypothetical protein
MDAAADRVAKVIKATIEAFKSSFQWTKPAPQEHSAIPSDSSPKFVAVRGLAHRMSAVMDVPQFKVTMNGRTTFSDVESAISVPISFKASDDRMVAKALSKVVQERDGQDPDEIRPLFCFDPVWQKERADSPDEKMEVKCTGIHFSRDELRTLLEQEAAGTHLVLVVVPAGSEIQDMTFCDNVPEYLASEEPFGPSVMALEWNQLRAALETPDMHTFVDKNASLAWATTAVPTPASPASSAGKKRRRDYDDDDEVVQQAAKKPSRDAAP